MQAIPEILTLYGRWPADLPDVAREPATPALD